MDLMGLMGLMGLMDWMEFDYFLFAGTCSNPCLIYSVP